MIIVDAVSCNRNCSVAYSFLHFFYVFFFFFQESCKAKVKLWQLINFWGQNVPFRFAMSSFTRNNDSLCPDLVLCENEKDKPNCKEHLATKAFV